MATTDEQYIQKIYDSQKESALNTLKSAYDNNVSSIDMAKKNTDTTAYDAKREAAGNAAITRQRLNETFAANGLNTGTAGQANLALLNQKAANLNDIETKRVAAQAEYDRQKAQLAQTYQSEVKNAILENDADRAAALYKLYQQQQEAAAAARGYSGSYSGSGTRSGGIIDDDGSPTTISLKSIVEATKEGGAKEKQPKQKKNSGVDDATYRGMRDTLYYGKKANGTAWTKNELIKYIQDDGISQKQAQTLAAYLGITLQ